MNRFCLVILMCQIFISIKALGTTRPRFYPKGYEDSRAEFVLQATKQIRKLKSGDRFVLNVPSEKLKDLSINGFYLPQSGQTKKLMVITCGVHGIEAFAGCALLIQLMSELEPEDTKGTGYLFLHAINPYGYSQKRRVTENNVDLNRNFIVDKSEFNHANAAYGEFNLFLNPTTKAQYSKWQKIKMFVKSIWLVATKGRKNLRQAIVGGQYEFPKGIFYGGKQAEPNTVVVRDALLKYGESYQEIFHIDLHTGFGEKGVLHLFSSNKFPETPDAIENFVFKDTKVDFAEDKNFYQVHGDFTSHTTQIFPKKKVLGMTFEFGTQDSQTLMGSYFSLRTIILENQGFLYEYENDSTKTAVEKDFDLLFNPENIHWRSRILREGKNMFEQLRSRFIEYKGTGKATTQTG